MKSVFAMIAALSHLWYAGQMFPFPGRASAGGATTPVTMLMVGGSNAAPAATYYLPPYGMDSGTVLTTDSAGSSEVIPISGVFHHIRYDFLGGTEDLGEDFTLTFRVNTTDTSMTCSVTGSNATTDTGCAYSSTDSGTINPGDMVSWKVTATGTPAATEDGVASVRFTSTSSNQSMVLGSVLVNSAAQRFSSLTHSRVVGTSTASDTYTPIPDDFTVLSFYMGSDVTWTNARNIFLCYSDGGSTDTDCGSAGRALMSCAIGTGGAIGCHDTDGCNQASCNVTAGNYLFIATSSAAASENKVLSWGVGLSNSSQHWAQFAMAVSWSTSAIRYIGLDHPGSPILGSREDIAVVVPAMTATQQYVRTLANLGAGSLAVALAVNDTASAENCSLDTTHSTCVDTDDVNISNNDVLNIMFSPSSSPPSQTGLYVSTSFLSIP